MAKNKVKEEYIDGEEENKSKLTATQTAVSYLENNKKDHYNFEEEFNYKISTSSLIFDQMIDAGVSNGCLRATGGSGNGKTSFILTLAKNFIDTIPSSRIIYARSEGRLSEQMRLRSGIKYVTNPADWVDGSCLILDSNVYEFVFGFFRELIINNPEKKKYFFVIDSADTLAKRDDLEKSFDEAQQSPGGAMLTSVFFKKVGLAMAKRGHIMAFISQVRDVVRIDPKTKVPKKQGGASGANALKHSANWVFEFIDRTEFEGDFIRENPSDKNSKILGHWCKIRIVKSDNETNETVIRYPIKYKCKNNSSVWIEYEVCDLLLMFDKIKKGGAGWFTLSKDLRDELSVIKPEIPEKIQGIDNIRKWLEENPEITRFLVGKFKNVLTN